MNDTGRAALALEELMLRDDAATVLRQVRDTGPAWLLDQLDAATAEIARAREAVVASGAARLDSTPVAQVPGWLRLGLLDTLVAWVTGSASTCLHAPDPLHPQPVHSAAWRPGLVVCGHCSHLLALPRRSDADRRCDSCGYITTGVENDDGIFGALITIGPLSYAFGVCRTCRHWQDAIPTNVTHQA